MRVMIVPLVALNWLLLSQPSVVEAGQSVGCNAVDALASVEADDKLSITVAKDPKGKTCVFYVRMPPNASASSTAQQEAADLTLLLSRTADKGVIEKLVPVIEAALYEPINAGKFDPASVEAWRRAQEDLSKRLAECSFDTFIAHKMSFVDYSDTFSCGTLTEGGYFVIEAKSPSLISALYLPLAQ